MKLKEDFNIELSELEKISEEILTFFADNYLDVIKKYLNTYNGKYFEKYLNITFELPTNFLKTSNKNLKYIDILKFQFLLDDFSMVRGEFIADIFNPKIRIIFRSKELIKLSGILKELGKEEFTKKLIELKKTTLTHELHHFLDNKNSFGNIFSKGKNKTIKQ